MYVYTVEFWGAGGGGGGGGRGVTGGESSFPPNVCPLFAGSHTMLSQLRRQSTRQLPSPRSDDHCHAHVYVCSHVCVCVVFVMVIGED